MFHEGKRLKRLLKKHGKRIIDLANELQVTQSAVNQWLVSPELPKGRVIDIENYLGDKFRSEEGLMDQGVQASHVTDPKMLIEFEKLYDEISILKARIFDIEQKLKN